MLNSLSLLPLLKEIKEDAPRRLEELRNMRIYEGTLNEEVEARLKKLFPKTGHLYAVAEYNLHEKVTKKKSKAYQRAPQRSLDKKEETEKLNQILSDFNFNDAMKLMDTYKNRHRYCGLGVIRKRSFDESMNPKDSYNFWALAPYDFVVHRDANGEIYAWSIPMGKDTDGRDLWVIWTREAHVKLATKDYIDYQIVPIDGNPGNVNPYGMIPFVYVPIDATGSYPMTLPLPRQTIELCTSLSIYLTAANMQIGQMVISHPIKTPIDQVAHGLMTAITLPQGGREGEPDTTVEYISPGSDLSGMREAITTSMMLILDQNGINGTSAIKEGETFSSGFDRLLANADVQDIIEDNQDLYTRVENEIYKVIKAMNDRDKSYSFTSVKVSIVFAKPKILSSDSEKLDNLKKKKDLGLWEDFELIMEADPNLSEADAKAKAIRLKGVAMVNSGDSFKVGDTVMVKPGKEHMPEHAGMNFTVSEISNGTYALKMPDGKIHKWYTGEELMSMGG